MDKTFHRFSELFAQMGLPTGSSDIEAFLRLHSPLSGEIALADAAFWTPAQAAFLREEWREDADWAEVVDQLNAALRAPSPT